MDTPGFSSLEFRDYTKEQIIEFIEQKISDKTDVTRIFDPMTNQNANAWKIDYRKYHDLWIMDNGMDGVLVSVGE